MQAQLEGKQAEVPMYFKPKEGGEISKKRCRITEKAMSKRNRDFGATHMDSVLKPSKAVTEFIEDQGEIDCDCIHESTIETRINVGQ